VIKPARCLWLTLLLPACGTVREWREMQTEPMSFGACYDGLDYIAVHDGYRPDPTETDRGLGTWRSRWRQRDGERHFRYRFRLKAEVLVDEGSNEKGWPVRYVVEQETVKDLRRYTDPREEDWSAAGQDQERETILGEKLVRRLAPKSVSERATGPARP
jgi:hypothetical protein